MAIIYGWAEGPWHARRLIRAAEKKFRIVQEPKQADIILAHSAGCYLIPETANAKLILLIGVPYWPGKQLIVRIWQKIVSDFRAHHREGEVRFWIAKTIHNLWYLFRFLPSSFRMLRAQLRPSFYNGRARVLAIRNHKDPFCDPVSLERIAKDKNWEYLPVGSIHDECWLKPGAYLRFMEDSDA